MNRERFGILAGIYYESGEIPVDRFCFGFSLINRGADTVKVNNIVLRGYPPGHPELSGESFSFVDPLSRFYTENFTITFESVVDPRLQIIQFFVKEKMN